MTRQARLIPACFLFLCLLPSGLLLAQDEVEPTPFFDSFEDNRHGWPLMEEQSKAAWLEEGAYRVSGNSGALPVFVSVEMPGLEADSFSLTVSITQLDGRKNMGYGLCWGARPDRRDCYVFLISSNQKFTILRMERGKYRQLQPWTETDLIVDKKEPNVLAVTREGDRQIYFINGQRVFVGAADPLRGNLCGVLLHGKMDLAIEEIELKLPGNP